MDTQDVLDFLQSAVVRITQNIQKIQVPNKDIGKQFLQSVDNIISQGKFFYML
ncbi:MAG: hypothetical protein GXP45_04115 [bacterium]|nr:hypothetical protein [bacterium]